MTSWFEDENKVAKTIYDFRLAFPSIINHRILSEVKSKGNAVYRGIMSLLAIEKASDFETNEPLENARENDQHHVFPESQFGNFSVTHSILNRTWLSGETNRRISAKKPKNYTQEFLEKFYDNNEDKFRKMLQTHFINNNAFERMKNNDIEGFIQERGTTIIEKIAERIGLKSTKFDKTLLSPTTEYDNEMIIENTIKKCEEHLHWIDSYFRSKGFKWLRNYLLKDKVKEIKILTSIDTATEDLRDLFKKFRNQMSHDGISCELRVMADNKLKREVHGRWIITKNECFSVQSVDTVSFGAVDEIRGGAEKPPFEKWWEKSLDIINDWNKIKEDK